ncbi:MAG: response regulator [Pseudolabrys sp.]
MRRLTRTMLTNLGAKSVLEAPDGLAALEAIRTADPDVMLLDWDMPVLNGSQNF